MATDESIDFGGAISGALQDRGEEDGPPLNILAGAPTRTGNDDKISLQEASNLLTLRQARQDLLEGAISCAEFIKKVATVHREISGLLDLYDLDQVRKELEKADEAERAVAEATLAHLETIISGIDRMLDFAQSQDPTDLDEGLQLVEKGYLDLDRSQDEAISILDSLDDDEDED